MALQFEWAWQHCDKSLAVRAILGDTESRKLKLKRGIQGQLSILKTMLLKCPDIYENNKLTLYFFKQEYKSIYESIAVQEVANKSCSLSPPSSSPPPSRLSLSSQIGIEHIQSVKEMPFYMTQNALNNTILLDKNPEQQQQRLDPSVELNKVDIGNVSSPSANQEQRSTSLNKSKRNSMGSLYRRCQHDYDLLFGLSSSDDSDDDDFDLKSLHSSMSNSSSVLLVDQTDSALVADNPEKERNKDIIHIEDSSSPDEDDDFDYPFCDKDSDEDDEMSLLTSTFTNLNIPVNSSPMQITAKQTPSTFKESSCANAPMGESTTKDSWSDSDGTFTRLRARSDSWSETDETFMDDKTQFDANTDSTSLSVSTEDNPPHVIDLCSP
jgi:hypothetical protein